MLDAKLGIRDKIDLAGVLLADLDPEDPRDSLDRSFANATRDAEGDKLTEIGTLRRRADDTLVEGILDAFAPSFLISGALALLAAGLLIPPGQGARKTLAVTAARGRAAPGRDGARPRRLRSHPGHDRRPV